MRLVALEERCQIGFAKPSPLVSTRERLCPQPNCTRFKSNPCTKCIRYTFDTAARRHLKAAKMSTLHVRRDPNNANAPARCRASYARLFTILLDVRSETFHTPHGRSSAVRPLRRSVRGIPPRGDGARPMTQWRFQQLARIFNWR